MIKISETMYEYVGNALNMLPKLNNIATESIQNGYSVERGFLGIVILKLEDGEVHFVPDGKCIKNVVWRYEQ